MWDRQVPSGGIAAVADGPWRRQRRAQQGSLRGIVSNRGAHIRDADVGIVALRD